MFLANAPEKRIRGPTDVVIHLWLKIRRSQTWETREERDSTYLYLVQYRTIYLLNLTGFSPCDHHCFSISCWVSLSAY